MRTLPFPDDPVDDLYAGVAELPCAEIVNLSVRHPIASPAVTLVPRTPSARAVRSAQALASPDRRVISKYPSGSRKVSEGKPTITLVAWRAVEKNTLRGFATVKFPMGLVIKDITVHTKNGNSWAGMPAKIQIGQDGEIRRKPDGKPEYTAVLEWSDRETADRFSAAVVRLVEEKRGALA